MTTGSNTKSKKLWKGKERRPDDTVMVGGKSDDIIIPIIGPTGAGKSTFINTSAGNDTASVGHDLKSHTAKIQHFILPHPMKSDRRIILVDTPGFDDTYIDDSEILRRIAVWLADSYSHDMKVAGIIYLYEITQMRILGSMRRNLEVFRRLCGDDSLQNVILATTKWEGVEESLGARRERQLRDEYWKPMLERGSRMSRFKKTQTSAWDIINLILQKIEGHKRNNRLVDFSDVLQIQKELVDLYKILPETEAAKALRHSLKELLEQQRKMNEDLCKSRGKGPEKSLQDSLQVNQEKIRTTLLQIKELKIPLSRRILTFLGLNHIV